MHRFLQRLFLVCVLGCALGNFKAFSQPLPCPVSTTSSVNAGNDTSVCNGQCATLHATSLTTMQSTSAYTFSQPVYSPAPYNQGTTILLAVDDQWSSAIPIPFAFCFFGTRYTQLWIGSNGNITFSQPPSSANAYGVSNAIPYNYSSYNNCIMAPFFDMDPRAFGQITYNTYGTAPCRTFVVSWDSCGTYPSASLGQPGNNYIATQQIVLYESTHVIDINVHTHTFYTGSTSSGNAVLGIQNATATQAYAAPGKNNSQFNITDESYRFVPSGPPSTFYTWTDATTGAIVGTGQNATVCPTTNTTYHLEALFTSQCDSVILGDNVTVNVGGNPHVDSAQVHSPSYCGNNDGSMVLFGLQPNTNYMINYSKNGVPQPQITIGSTAAGQVTIANLTSGIYSGIRASTQYCLSGNQIGPYTIIDPRIPVNFTSSTQYVCEHNDIVTFTNTTPTPGAINYEYRFGDGNTATTPNPVHTYVNQGNYPVTLVADNGVCRDSVTNFVDTRHPLDAFFLVDHQNACQFQTLQFKDSSVITYGNGPQPQFSWDFGDGNSGTGTTPTHAYQTVGSFVVRLIVTDFVPCTDTFYRTINVGTPPTVSFVSSESVICEGKGSLFTADFSAETPTGYEWTFGDGTTIYNTNPTTHSYDSAGVYTIKLVTHYLYCPDTNYSLPITVQPFPGINLGPDTSLCPSASPVTLFNHSDFGQYPGATYTWNTGATTPSINVNSEGTYGATINLNGCTASDSMTIFKDCYLDIPNSFTPNGDGLNDYFLPRQLLSKSVTGYKMNVFNRWGEVIFESATLDGRGWDGRFNGAVQPAGVYIYIIDVFFANGTKEHYTGNVTMIR